MINLKIKMLNNLVIQLLLWQLKIKFIAGNTNLRYPGNFYFELCYVNLFFQFQLKQLFIKIMSEMSKKLTTKIYIFS